MTVIAPKQFQARIDPEHLERLRTEGAQIEDASGIDEIVKREIQYGEELLGELTPEEASLFVAYHNARTEMDTIGRELSGDMMIKTGRHIQEHAEVDLAKLEAMYGDVDPEKAREFHRQKALSEYLFATLFYALGERFVSHDWSIGIRTKRRVVRVKRRW